MERRNKPRIYCDCIAFIEGDDMGGIYFTGEGRLVNLSASGMYIILRRRLEHGTRVTATVNLTNCSEDVEAPRLATNGIVVRTETQVNGLFGIAIKFHNYRFL